MEKQYLKPHIIVDIKPDETFLRAQKTYRILHKNQRVRNFFSHIKSGLPVNSFDDIPSEIMTFLEKNNFLWSGVHPYRQTIQEKQFEYLLAKFEDAEARQQCLFNCRVAILGCGGIGNIIVENLVAAGVRDFILIDYDRVDASNLNRQFCFKYTDINKTKTDSLAYYISERNPSAKIRCHNSYFASEKDILSADISSADLLICAADEPKFILPRMLSAYSIKTKLPIIFAGVGIDEGLVGPLLLGGLENVKYIDYIDSVEKQCQDIKTIRPSISYTNALVGSWLSKHVINFLIKGDNKNIFGKIILLDLMNFNSKIMRVFYE